MKTGSNTPFWVKELCAVLCSSLPAGGTTNSQKEEAAPKDMPSGLPEGGTKKKWQLPLKRSAAASTKKRPAGASLPEAGHVQKKPAVAASAAGQEVATELKGPAGAIVPAAGHVQKTEAVAAGQEVATELKGWLVSASFGEVKATRASQKSYIQARATASGKPYCLVNIEGKAGVDHRRVVDELVAGLNKAQVIAERDALKENVD